MNALALLLAICILSGFAQAKPHPNESRNVSRITSHSIPSTPANQVAQSECAKLEHLALARMGITSAVYVAADSLKLPPAEGLPAPIDLPAFCRVQGVLKPTIDSFIKYELWLPTSAWNGRFEQVGNGGFAGRIRYKFMIPELRNGFAVASTDDGHTNGADQSWAIEHPEKVIDYGYRAVHDTSTASKSIIRDFYNQAAAYSYFNGCSDGGREAAEQR